MDPQKTTLLTFTSLEHKHYNRGVDFYWAVGLIAVAVAVVAFILKDGLYGLLVIIGAGLYGYSSWKKPQAITVTITDKDISIGEDLYPITTITAFRILDIKDEKELVLNIRRTYHPMVSVSIPDGLEMQLKEILSRMLNESQDLVPHIGRRFMARFKI